MDAENNQGAPSGAPPLDPSALDVERLDLEADQAWRTLRAVIESHPVFSAAWKAFSTAQDKLYDVRRAAREKGL